MNRSDIVSPRGSTTPLDEDHLAIGQECALCEEPFEPGDVLSVIIIRTNANITLDNAHEDCAYDEED